MDDKVKDESSSGLSKEEEKLISEDTLRFTSEAMPTEEIRIELPKDTASVKKTPVDKAFWYKGETEGKPESAKSVDAPINIEDKTVVSQRLSSDRHKAAFYAFLGTAFVFYALSIWIILASLSICPLPESFRKVMLSFGKILS